jgi:hypothetical protein
LDRGVLDVQASNRSTQKPVGIEELGLVLATVCLWVSFSDLSPEVV